MVAALAGALYVHVQSDRDARAAGFHNADVAARRAASLIGSGVSTLEAALGRVSTSPAEVAGLLAHPSTCALSFAHVGAFPTGHIDIVLSRGPLVCSSLAAAKASRYARAPWARAALTGPAALAPVHDPLTGQPVAVFTAPFRGGFAVAAVNLAAVGPDLSGQLVGSEGIEYAVTTPGGATVLSDSELAARWTGVRLRSPVQFARANQVERRGLDGRDRLFALAIVPGLGWRVYAGIDRSVAMASAGQLFHRELLVILVALLIVLAATIVVHRRIAQPIARLAEAMNRGRAPSPDLLRGTAEVAELAASFHSLLGRLESELGERRRAEDAARQSAESYRVLFESNPMPMWIFDIETLKILQVNDAAIERYGYSREEFTAMTIKDLRPAEDVPAMMATLEATAGRLEGSGPWRHLRRDGTAIEVEISSHAVEFHGRATRLVMATDVTQRERLARQLAQTQRLESLGQLAGGVAHDFNNLLSIILNYARFVNDEIAAGTAEDAAHFSQAREDLEEIERAARRAAGLTHQLLAFARREVVHPEVMILDDVVEETEQLLRRTLGEHIELARVAGTESWPILADPGQMGQVLVNLAVNARDAMPSGGTLVIETANIDVDESYCGGRPGLVPGRYVRLRVSDTGAGMDKVTLEHAFEPFFTTKPKGQGTGLGLATVYGIVAQSGGHAQLYSEAGVGTTCSIMLPATLLPASAAPAPWPSSEEGAGRSCSWSRTSTASARWRAGSWRAMATAS